LTTSVLVASAVLFELLYETECVFVQRHPITGTDWARTGLTGTFLVWSDVASVVWLVAHGRTKGFKF
jgi:hypothetical protein